MEKGHLHPITSVIREISLIFDKIGFQVAQGPELETEFYNFDALNVPPDHPARDMQDTFWVSSPSSNSPLAGGEDAGRKDAKRFVLRTHTTSVDVRYLESIKDNPKPFKIIIPGKVYRNEATDATHEAQFYQLDGLYFNKNVSMTELIGTFDFFFKEFLGPDVKMRIRPSYFGFVEPGIEVDVWWQSAKTGEGKWLEMFGAGILHPNVMRAAGLDPKAWKAFAFGGGIDRLVMLRYGVDDVRHLYSGDLRLINQF